MQRIIDVILTICGMYSFCMLRNFPLGSLFVFIMFAEQVYEYRKERSKANKVLVCAWTLALIFVLILSYLDAAKK